MYRVLTGPFGNDIFMDLRKSFLDLTRGILTEETESGPLIQAPTDIWKEEDSLKLSMELPGLKKEDIKVSLGNGVLSILAEKKGPDNRKDTIAGGRRYGSFKREYQVDDKLDPKKIKANFEDGVLNLDIGYKKGGGVVEVPIS